MEFHLFLVVSKQGKVSHGKRTDGVVGRGTVSPVGQTNTV